MKYLKLLFLLCLLLINTLLFCDLIVDYITTLELNNLLKTGASIAEDTFDDDGNRVVYLEDGRVFVIED